MKNECVKCGSDLDEGTVRLEGGQAYALCKFCSAILKNRYTNIVHDFMTDQLEMSDEDRNMLDARMARRDGIRKWADKTDGDNRGQDVIKMIDMCVGCGKQVPVGIMCNTCYQITCQPERSKREDSEYGAKCDFGILKSEMRCSEHCGNAVSWVQ